MITISLLLRKSDYPYEYMDDWEKYNETSLPEKENFYSHLNMEDISDRDYARIKCVCKNFEIKSLEKYLDLHFQTDISLLADVFGSFRNIYFETCGLDPARFLSTSRISIATSFKRDKRKIRSFN